MNNFKPDFEPGELLSLKRTQRLEYNDVNHNYYDVDHDKTNLAIYLGQQDTVLVLYNLREGVFSHWGKEVFINSWQKYEEK